MKEVAGTAIVFLILMGLIWSSIDELRREHHREIYAIWYVFSLFFLIFLPLYYFSVKHDTDVTAVLGPSKVAILQTIYDYLTDVKSELILVAAIVVIGIGPQLLAYFLAV